MKNKTKISIFAGLLVLMAAGFYFNRNTPEQPVSIFEPKVAQAMGPCYYPSFKVRVIDLDTNPQTVLGTFTAGQYAAVAYNPTSVYPHASTNIPPGYGNPGNPLMEYNVEIPLGHRVRYEFVDMVGISVGPGNDGYERLLYSDGNYSYSASNGWEPNPPNPFPNLRYDAPPKTSSATSFYVGRDDGYCYHRFLDYNWDPPRQVEGLGTIYAEIQIYSGEPGGPGGLTRKEFGTSLAVIERPTVDLKVNGQSSALVPVGATPNLTWTTNSVAADNSCTAANNNNPLDATWVGAKNGPGGGSQQVGPMNTEGTFIYSMTCTGYSGAVSEISQVIITVGEGDDFAFTCTPAAHYNVPIGSSRAYNLSTAPIGNFNSAVSIATTNIEYEPSGEPGDYEQPTVTFNPNSAQVPPAEITAMVGTNAGTGLGQYTFTFTATGGGRSHSCEVDFELVDSNNPPPNPPTVTADSSAECDKVFITFAPNGLPAPSSYKLYRGVYPIDPSDSLLQTFGPSDPRQYVDTIQNGAQTSNNFYFVIAYNGVTPSGPGVAGPANVRACAPAMDTSDKDLIKVVGKFTKNFAPNICSGSVPNTVILPGGAIFAVGDILTFEIHVCNTGDKEAVNVEVRDKLYNPNNPDTQYNLREPQFVDSTGNCAQPISGGGEYGINFSVPYVGIGGVCTIRFTAKLFKPDNPTAQVYRFQNTGVIIVPGIADTPYYSPPYLFSLNGGVPERNETAPQN